MQYTQPLEPLEVTNVNRQDLWNTVNVHARSKPGIVDLHAFDFVLHKEPPP